MPKKFRNNIRLIVVLSVVIVLLGLVVEDVVWMVLFEVICVVVVVVSVVAASVVAVSVVPLVEVSLMIFSIQFENLATFVYMPGRPTGHLLIPQEIIPIMVALPSTFLIRPPRIIKIISKYWYIGKNHVLKLVS